MSHLWIDADVTIDLLCSIPLGGADIGGKVSVSGLVCESGELLSGCSLPMRVAPMRTDPANRRTLLLTCRLSCGGFAVEKERISFARQRIAAGRQGLPAGNNLAACHAQRVAAARSVSAMGHANPG